MPMIFSRANGPSSGLNGETSYWLPASNEAMTYDCWDAGQFMIGAASPRQRIPKSMKPNHGTWQLPVGGSCKTDLRTTKPTGYASRSDSCPKQEVSFGDNDGSAVGQASIKFTSADAGTSGVAACSEDCMTDAAIDNDCSDLHVILAHPKSCDDNPSQTCGTYQALQESSLAVDDMLFHRDGQGDSPSDVTWFHLDTSASVVSEGSSTFKHASASAELGQQECNVPIVIAMMDEGDEWAAGSTPFDSFDMALEEDGHILLWSAIQSNESVWNDTMYESAFATQDWETSWYPTDDTDSRGFEVFQTSVRVQESVYQESTAPYMSILSHRPHDMMGAFLSNGLLLFDAPKETLAVQDCPSPWSPRSQEAEHTVRAPRALSASPCESSSLPTTQGKARHKGHDATQGRKPPLPPNYNSLSSREQSSSVQLERTPSLCTPAARDDNGCSGNTTSFPDDVPSSIRSQLSLSEPASPVDFAPSDLVRKQRRQRSRGDGVERELNRKDARDSSRLVRSKKAVLRDVHASPAAVSKAPPCLSNVGERMWRNPELKERAQGELAFISSHPHKSTDMVGADVLAPIRLKPLAPPPPSSGFSIGASLAGTLRKEGMLGMVQASIGRCASDRDFGTPLLGHDSPPIFEHGLAGKGCVLRRAQSVHGQSLDWVQSAAVKPTKRPAKSTSLPAIVVRPRGAAIRCRLR